MREIMLEKVSLATYILIGLLGGIMLGVILAKVQGQEDIAKLSSFRPTIPSRVYDVNGELIAEFFQENRQIISLEEVPQTVITAFIEVEDSNFYSHFGIDLPGILRAVIANIKAGRIVQGGSTLTQQLAKGIFTKGEKTFLRKAYEAVLALQIEKEFTKNDILEMYFNQTYFGHGNYGIASAANFYFKKKVNDLNLAEATILAGLPKSPHTYSPFRSSHRCRKKNLRTLLRLAELGYLTTEEARAMHKEYWQKYWPIVMTTAPSKNSFGQKENKAPYFVEFIRQEMVKNFSEEEVYLRGLQIHTSLNLKQQRVADRLIQEAVTEQDPIVFRSNNQFRRGIDYDLLQTYRYLRQVLPLGEIVNRYSLATDFREKYRGRLIDAVEMLSLAVPQYKVNRESRDFYLAGAGDRKDVLTQGAFISLEQSTGRITTMIGGREFKASDQFNRATLARRQPGSSFKPFVYGAALEERAVHSAYGFLDSPLLNLEEDGSMWAPANYMGNYRGFVKLDKALSYSLNLVSIQLFDLVGARPIIDFSNRTMNVQKNRFQPNPSLALGSSELTPLEMAKGYAVIANEGREVIPHGILYVTDREGQVLMDFEAQVFSRLNEMERKGEIQKIEPGIAYIVRKLLEGVVRSGTATEAVKIKGQYRGPAAGKTGTTSSWSDAWFTGFSSDLTAVVWLGLDSPQLSLGTHQSGGLIAAPIWGKFMKQSYDSMGVTPAPFKKSAPQGVYTSLVSSFNGRWPNPECNENLSVAFVPSARKINGRLKRVYNEIDDCNHQKTMNFLEFLQQEHSISDEEINKEKKIRQIY